MRQGHVRAMLRLVTFAIIVAAIPGVAAAQQPAPFVIKFSHVVAPDTPKGQAALKFKEEAERRLPGQVRIEVYPNSTLFGDARETEALLLGDVQMLATSLSKFDKFTSRLQLFDLPFLFDDEAAFDRFQRSAAGRELLRAMQPKNILGLAYWHNGLKQLSANKPLLLPDDATGLTFRIQDSDLLAAQFQALGATPKRLPFDAVHAALKSGDVDGQENTWSNILTQRYHEVQKHITETNHGIIDYMVVVNAGWWNGLPQHIRAALEAAVEAATRTNNDIARKLNDEARTRIVASGLTTIHRLDAAQRAEWKEAMAPVWQLFEPAIGRRLIQAAQRANRAPTN